MITTILFTVLSFPYVCPSGAVCSGKSGQSASATIEVQVRVMAAEQMAINVYQTDPNVDDIFTVETAMLATGEDYMKEKEKFLIIDNRTDKNEVLVVASLIPGSYDLDFPQNVVALRWDKSKQKQLVALFKAKKIIEGAIN